VGTPETWSIAAECAAPGGAVLLFGGCAAGTRACFDTFRLHYEEVDLIGAFHYGRADVAEAWRSICESSVRVGPLITHARSLDRVQDALGLVLSREAIKVAIHP
jgi:L-iditol 2-dehydrogenase